MNKKKIVALGIAFIMVYTIGWLMGDASAVSRIKKNISGSLAQSESLFPPQDASAPVKEVEARSIDYGQVAELGQFEFKILGSESTKEAKTSSKSISTTTNLFEIVKLEVVNKRNAPAQLKDFKMRLLDTDTKTTYDLNSDVSISMSSALKSYDKKPAVYLYDDMNPSLNNEFTAVFEVPTDANYALQITYKKDVIMMKLK